MRIARLAATSLLLILTGCAHMSQSGVHLAQGSAYLCKHCNCFMPADVEENALCPICDCGYQAYQCHRGR